VAAISASFGLHSQLGDFVQDHRKQAPQDRHFGQLERHVLRMPHDLGAVKFQLHGGIKLEPQTPFFSLTQQISRFYPCLYIKENKMRAYIQKWGNSLALRIPRAFGKELGITEATPVEICIDKSTLTVKAK
jgi:hypothetical protein